MLDLAAEIPLRARRVVELGCGSGKTGEAFLRRQPEADYWGAETSREAVGQAALRLPHALCVLPGQVDFEGWGLYEADVLILREPYLAGLTAERLQQWSSLLSEEGQLLVELPNAGYVRRVMAQLAALENVPTLPTLEELKAMAQGAGFPELQLTELTEEEDRELREAPEMVSFLTSFVKLCHRFSWKVSTNVWAHAYFLRFSRRAVPASRRLMVHTMLGETIVTARARVYDPCNALQTEMGVGAVAERGGYHPEVDKGFGQVAVIRQRIHYTSYQQAAETVAALRSMGHLIVTENDDNPWFFEKEQEDSHGLDFAGAHAVQVSTETIAEMVRPFNPWVRVFANQLKELPPKRDYALEKQQHMQEGGSSPVTVFFGALNRTEEWQDIMPVLNEAIRRYGDRLRFKVLSDRGFYEALETEAKEFVSEEGRDYGGQFVSYELYQQTLHASDISLLPLRDTEFNRAKSDLKFIESAGHGAVALASPVVYEQTIRDGCTGFIYRNPREFAARLALLVEDEARRREMAEAAYGYVRRERLLCQHYLERLDWYRELFERLPELDRALAQRMEQAEKERQA